MSGPGSPGAIVVTGGSGGLSVALDDLGGAVLVLGAAAESVGAVAAGVDRLDLWTLGTLLSGADTVAALTRLEWHRRGLARALGGVSRELDDLSRRTRVVIADYRLAETEATVAVALARAVVVSAARSLQALGEPVGLLVDGRAGPARSIPVDAASRVELWDLASVVTSQSLLSGRPVVRVVETPRPDGSSAWVLQIPGTQVWDPRAGPVAHDLTSDVRLMGGEEGVLAVAAVDALAQAQTASGRLGRGDPVMVTGHSLGGIAAMAIGADAGVRGRFRVTHVVTAGAPVGHVDVPDDVVVLSLEHVDDPVHRADLVPNPERANWTTVRRDVPGGRILLPGAGPREHAALTYRETARLATVAAREGAEPSLVSWSASAAPFFLRPPATPAEHRPGQRVRDYGVRRVTESRS